MDILQTGILQRYAAGNGCVHRADDSDVLQGLGKRLCAGIAVQHHIRSGHGHVYLTAGHVLHVLEGAGRSLGVTFDSLNAIGPQLGQCSTRRIQRAAGVAGTKGHHHIAAARSPRAVASAGRGSASASTTGQKGCCHRCSQQDPDHSLCLFHFVAPFPYILNRFWLVHKSHIKSSR